MTAKRLLLGGIYLGRSAALALFFLFPPTPLSVVLFGATMGMLWLGVIPLVNGLVVQIFGLRYLSTLTGIALVPLCPHALTNRPIIVNDQVNIELVVVQADDPRVHFDGQVTLDLLPGDSVRLKRSEHTICFLHPPGYSYFAMLRQKLHWSERPKGP